MSTFYKIEEAVGGGYYITWDGIYTTKEAAEEKIRKIGLNTDNLRAVLYQTGGWPGHGHNGPVRANTDSLSNGLPTRWVAY